MKLRHRNTTFGRAAPLGDLALVLPGYSEKDVLGSDHGPLRMLQARDVQPAGAIDWRHLVRCFAVLRCKPGLADATFLCWLLNTDSVRAQLRSAQRGTAMPFLGMADLKAFPLRVPPLSTQRAIARVHGLRLRMSRLATRLDRAVDRILEHSARSSD